MIVAITFEASFEPTDDLMTDPDGFALPADCWLGDGRMRMDERAAEAGVIANK